MVELSYLILEDYTNFCWSVFLKEMSELKDLIFTLLTDLKIAGTDIKFIRCDGSGKPSYDCCANEYNINFELPGPRFPQRNGKVERERFRHSMAGHVQSLTIPDLNTAKDLV
jgi:hypothetical protein